MPIRILSDELAAKIAAGEVIERPASVVKELIENALDAEAHDIRVEVRGGGQRLLRVADDGWGIPAAQVATAFARHATSKIQSADDLFAIHTLGFRGEALPSIAAVARVNMITRAHDEDSGTLFRVEGGRVLAHQPQGAPRGTAVTVEDLFHSVPARLKFLKAPGTEAGHVVDLIYAYALAYPHVRFSLVNDGRLLFHTSGNGRLFDVLIKVFGTETGRGMIEVGKAPAAEASDEMDGGEPAPTIRVGGFVSPPAVHRATRKGQYLFVNGRWIEDRSLAHAVVEAYHTLLMVGRFPLFILRVELPPDIVDVNVHPTKAQVRFRDPGEVYRVVQRTVRRALTDAQPVPGLALTAPGVDRSLDIPGIHLEQGPGEGAASQPGAAPGGFEAPGSERQPVGSYSPSATFAAPVPPLPGARAGVPMLRVIGQIASTYIIAEGPEGLYLVDQHAAHERVLYEQLLAARGSAQMPSQELLEPVAVNLSVAQWAVYEQERVGLAQVGFRMEPFGGQTLMLRAVPAVLRNREPRAVVPEIMDELGEGATPLERDAEARLIKSICKSAAVKGGQTLALEEMRALLRDLEKTSAPRSCPHGRPTMIQLNLTQLAREFGRRG